jgi:hypothetical protein
MLDTKEQVESWVYKNFDVPSTTKISLSPSNEIVVNGDIVAWGVGQSFPQLPVRFKKVTGVCGFASMGLESLLGAPQECGSFYCSGNELESLEHGPTTIVGGEYNCSYNRLSDLTGLPTEIPGRLSCHGNWLTSLQGFPNHVGTSVDLTWHNSLPLLRTLVAKEVGFSNTGDTFEKAYQVAKILNKYAGQGKRAMFDCQKDLEDAGFEGNARW